MSSVKVAIATIDVTFEGLGMLRVVGILFLVPVPIISTN